MNKKCHTTNKQIFTDVSSCHSPPHTQTPCETPCHPAQNHLDRTEHYNTVHHSKAFLCAKNRTHKYPSKLVAMVTWACRDGFNFLPHSSHLRHHGCQSLPNESLLSAVEEFQLIKSVFEWQTYSSVWKLYTHRRSKDTQSHNRIYSYD